MVQTRLGYSVWEIDLEHSNVQFSIDHMVICETLGFISDFSGRIETSNMNFQDAKLEVQLNPASLYTNNKKRDAHLISPDFFDIVRYPTIKFVSTAFRKVAERKFQIEGRLTLKGVTRSVVLDADYRGIQKDPWGTLKVGFRATTVIKRIHFNLMWDNPMDRGAFFIGNDVRIQANVELIRK